MARSTGGGNTQNVSPAKSTANRSAAARQEATTTSSTKKTGLTPAEVQQIRNTGAARMGSDIVSPPRNPGNPPGNPDNPPGTPFDAMSDEQYLNADTIFAAQKAALDAALAAYEQDTNAQKQVYETNYGNSLRKLGFTGDNKMLDTAKWDANANNGAGGWLDSKGAALGGINWNETDRETASGRGFLNQLNDFASRGMLRSSGYLTARNDLSRSLNEQLASTAEARNNALADYARQLANKKTETTNAKNNAAQEALARIKSGYGI